MERTAFCKYRLLVLLFLSVVAVGVIWFIFRSKSSGRIRNILLISIDTCRADRLSCYGYPRKTTPNIDAIAEEGFLFENVVTPVPLTLPAHSSMLAGTGPLYHGVHDNIDYRLGQSNVTVAEILKDNGFTTGAIVSAFVLDSQFGLDQGFDSYDDQFDEEHYAGDISERKGAEASRHAIKWLDEHYHQPFFLFLHYYDPHFPYEPPEPFKSDYAQAPYASEIAYTDHCIGQVIDRLKSLDLYDSTLIVVTGDHGESIGEHGEQTHGYFIYQGAIKVPLIVRLPVKCKAQRIEKLAGLIDVAPTILGALGLGIPTEVTGKNLLSSLTKKNPANEDRYLYCESLTPTKYQCNSLLGIVSNRFKYIQTTRPELYDLSKDAHELNNLVNQQQQLGRVLQDRLKQILEEQVRGAGSDSKFALDSESKARLESLGYVSRGKIDESFEFDRSQEDPKDYIKFHVDESIVASHINHTQFEEAREICEQMVSEYPDIAYGHFLLGKIAFTEGKFDEAVTHHSQASRLKADFRDAYCHLGVAYAHMMKLDDAIKNWNEALKYGSDPKVHKDLADALIYQGKVDEAIGHWEESLKLDGDNAKVHADLAHALTRKGRVDQAILHLTESLRLEPAQPILLNALAELFYTQGKVNEAIRHWQQALSFQPDSPRVLNNLAWIMATHPDKKFRNPAKAVEFAESSCELTGFANPESLDTLSAAYAASGKFDEAVQTAQKAEKLFSSAGLKKKVKEIQNRLELYKTGQPYREEP